MNKLKFYTVDVDYLDYLRQVDNKVPEGVELGNAKPFCGIIIEIDGYKYYAPISSFSVSQQTNFLIKDDEKVLSSIRFCFMIPVPDDVLTIIDFNTKEVNYKSLLEKEYRYCDKHADAIRKRAKNIYKLCSKRENPLNRNCCNFKALEIACNNYKKA